MEGISANLNGSGVNSPNQRVDIKPFIDGKSKGSYNSGTITLYNPATGKKSIEIPVGCNEDVAIAVASSRKAFEDGRWTNLQPSSRQNVLHNFARLIEDNAEELNVLDALDMGKPVSLEFGDAKSAADLLRYYANAIDNLTGAVYNSDKTTFVAQRLFPHGVVAAIVPWNFPVMGAITKIAPALAAGNSVVLKPSELSPRSAMRLAEFAIEAGVPPGVLNLVHGRGELVGKALALSKLVDMIAFTGSSSVGKLILQYAGRSNLKIVHAECGGKSPHVVFSDCNDLDAVAENISRLIVLNQGQLCVTGSRVLVQEEIESELIGKISIRLKDATKCAGDPLNRETTYGPLANRAQLNKILSYISKARDQAELIYGGNILLTETGGYFVEPSLFAKVPPSSEIAQEEIFGPLLSVTAFKTVDEAINLANSTQYGLAAYVWTSSLATGMRLSREINAGMVCINNKIPVGEGAVSMATEPYGLSGVGAEYGMEGLRAYMRRQVAWFNHG